jgi:hypothetical protein
MAKSLADIFINRCAIVTRRWANEAKFSDINDLIDEE